MHYVRYNDILQNRDSDYVYKKLIKAATIAGEKGHVILGLETQIDSEMDGLNHVVVDVNRRLTRICKRTWLTNYRFLYRSS